MFVPLSDNRDCTCKAPDPDMALGKLYTTVELPLKDRVALFTIGPEPIVPGLKRRVPALTVVPPE